MIAAIRQRGWGAWAAVGAVAVVVMGGGLAFDIVGGRSDDPSPDLSARSFHADSWWNTPLPAEVPLDPAAEDILHYLRTGYESGPGCLMLAGAGDSHWGQPVYDARPSDPSYDIKGLADPLPELEELRIPEGAQSASNSDRSMAVYDEDRDVWSAAGASITYLDSNGLHEATGESDDPRNRGSHRGNNGAVMAVEIDEVQSGAIHHVLKVASGPEVADRYVFPMIGSDGDYHGSDPGVPPQGLRFRIKPSIDLEELDLHPEALVIARALQEYGFYIGDSGGTTALKLQNTRAQGLGQMWSVSADALCDLPFTSEFWDVVAEDYDPTETKDPR